MRYKKKRLYKNFSFIGTERHFSSYRGPGCWSYTAIERVETALTSDTAEILGRELFARMLAIPNGI